MGDHSNSSRRSRLLFHARRLMPRARKPDPKPKRRPVGTGSIVIRSDGRIACILPPDLDPSRKARYGPGNRRRWQSVEEATAWLDAAVARLRHPPPRPGGPDEPLGGYLVRYLALHAGRWPARTAANYRRALRHVAPIADVRVGDLTHEHVLGALVTLAQATWRRQKRVRGLMVPYGPPIPYAASTVRQVRAALHTALEELVPHVLPFNPCKRARLGRQQPAIQPVWDADQVERFEAAALRLRPDLYFPLRLVTRRALRRGEVLALKSDDLDMRRRIVTVDETAGDRAGIVGETKGRKRREVPLGELAEDARQHALRRSRPSRWLVPGQRDDKPFSLRQFNSVVKQLAEAAGLDPIGPKDLRASAATILLDQNVSLARVSRLLGHASVSTTSIFYDRVLRSTQGRSDELADEFDAAFRRASETAPADEIAAKGAAC